MWNLFKTSLALQMAVATLLGILFGVLFGDLCSVFAPWGSAYIMILKVTTIPYLICAIIHGIGKLASGMAKQILQKGAIFIGATWVINILMIYLIIFLFPTTKGVPYASYSMTPPAMINFAEFLIPENIFYALSNNVVPAIVVFGLVVGIALMHIKEKQSMMSLLETLVEALTRVTRWISRITPIGTFLIIANQVGTIRLFTVQQISTYLALYIIVICVIVFWIFPRITSMFTNIPAGRWVKDLVPILLLAYTTNVVIVTLPFIIELVKKETENFYHKDGAIKDQIQGIVSTIFNLPLGSLFICVYVFFVAVFYHIPLSIGSQFQLFLSSFLTSLGSVGLGSWINSLNFLLDSLGLPLDAVDLYVTTLPFTAGFQSMLSVMEITSLSLFIALACHDLLTIRWRKIARSVVITAAPVLLVAFALKIYNPLPVVAHPFKSICDLEISPPIAVTVDKKAPSGRGGDVFNRIMSSSLLRVGYNREEIPFSFENSDQGLVGYDIAFAYELAKDLGCDLELVPMNYGNLAKELNDGIYDIGMAGISITEERLKQICFSDPYVDAPIAFVMERKLSKEITSVEALISRPHIKVVVLKGSSYEALARNFFPSDKIVTVDSNEDFASAYPHDVLIRGQPQGISWTLRYPQFSVVTPNPPLGKDSLAYAVRADADRFLCFINQWLKLKQNEEFTEKQYDLWVLGKTENLTPEEPRWSIIRNVFHWIE